MLQFSQCDSLKPVEDVITGAETSVFQGLSPPLWALRWPAVSVSGTEEWATSWARTGGTCLMSWSFRQTNPASSTTGGSECVASFISPPAVRPKRLEQTSEGRSVSLGAANVLTGWHLFPPLCLFPLRPFRRVTDKGALLWDRIHRLDKGKIYKQVRTTLTPLFTFSDQLKTCFLIIPNAPLITAGKPLRVPEADWMERLQSALLWWSHLQRLGSKQQQPGALTYSPH